MEKKIRLVVQVVDVEWFVRADDRPTEDLGHESDFGPWVSVGYTWNLETAWKERTCAARISYIIPFEILEQEKT